MKHQICIMLECQDNKIIFTHKKNLNYIIEFAKNFNIKVHYAKTDLGSITNLDNIAKVFCDQNYKSPSEYNIIKKNVLKNPENRKVVTNKAHVIRAKIKDLILANKKITFKQIQEAFNKENISISSLSNHFKHVRTELSLKGMRITKIKNGIYNIITDILS